MKNILFTIAILLCCTIGAQAKGQTTILCFGNSLTAGFGLQEQDAYPAQLQKKLLQTYKKEFNVINSGISGELSEEGLKRLPEILAKIPVLDYFILELGVNDAFQKKDINATKANLIKIIQLVQTTYPHCKIILSEVKLSNMLEPGYNSKFEAMYASIAAITKVTHQPSLMDGIPGNSQYNLDDGLHPNEKGTVLMMENVFKVLAPMIK